jgi:hypothetical protein
MPALRSGSPLTTPNRTSPAWPDAGVQAAEAAASSARTDQIRAASASWATAAFTAGSSVHAQTSQAPAQSPGAYSRDCHRIRPAAARSCSEALIWGETTSTSAPASSRPGTRRVATPPPPATRTRRPCRRRARK